MIRAALAVLIALTPAVAGATDEDPIDAALQSCLDTAASTATMRSCVATASAAWDAALNDAYKAAMSARDEEGRTALREAQRAWLAYRDADAAFRAQDYRFGTDGTIKLLELDDAGLSVVRARAQVLRGFASPN